jgi:hypothetical protein
LGVDDTELGAVRRAMQGLHVNAEGATCMMDYVMSDIQHNRVPANGEMKDRAFGGIRNIVLDQCGEQSKP